MSSFDGGGSAQRDPPEAHLPPPVDPWLTGASTSHFGDAGSLPGFGETPPDDPVPSGGGGADAPPRRVSSWVLAVLAVVALFAAGLWVAGRFRPGGDDARRPGPSAGGGQGGTPTATVTPRTSATAGAPRVVYEVTASGSRNTGSVTYTDRDGEIIRLQGISLPWRLAFPAGDRRKPLVLLTQRKSGGDAGPVTCTITVDGKLLSSTTAHGRYASALCSGSG